MTDPRESFDQRPGAVVHDFQQSLDLSEQYADAPWWERVYRNAFPSFHSTMVVRKDGWAQRGGIDRKVWLASGKEYSIDQKVRGKDWPDFCLEYYSDQRRQTPGWVAKDLACDFIAYAFIPSQRCYLLPFAQLRLAWYTHGREWMEKARRGTYKRILAQNQGYITESVGVPIPTVMKALEDAMVVDW